MEMKFNRTVLQYLQSVALQAYMQEETQQIRLTDTMPDVERILSSWGQVILRSKEWSTDSLQVTGGVAARVLYMPKDAQKPQCVDAWVPFQMHLDIPESNKDGIVTVRPFLRSLDARTLSDRKILVRATIGLTIDAAVSCEANLYSTGDNSEHVQMLRNDYLMQLPTEMGEKHFTVEESLNFVPAGEEVTLLRYTVEPVLEESKIIADKLVMRGNAIVDVLYMDASCGIHNWSTVIPISQYVQLSQEYDTDAYAEICFAITDLELESTDNVGYMVKSGILAQYTIYSRRQISVIEDAYCNDKKLEIDSEMLYLPATLDRKEEEAEAEIDLELPGHEILDATMFVEELQSDFVDALLCAKIKGTFQVLSIDPEGNLQNTLRAWEDDWRLDASPDIATDMSVVVEGIPKVRGQKISVPLKLKLICRSSQPLQMIRGIDIGETLPADPNRPSLIVMRAENESLWELAKRTGSTMSDIKNINEDLNEPITGKLLLIPIS